jgi:hypothetical protein
VDLRSPKRHVKKVGAASVKPCQPFPSSAPAMARCSCSPVESYLLHWERGGGGEWGGVEIPTSGGAPAVQVAPSPLCGGAPVVQVAPSSPLPPPPPLPLSGGAPVVEVASDDDGRVGGPHALGHQLLPREGEELVALGCRAPRTTHHAPKGGGIVSGDGERAGGGGTHPRRSSTWGRPPCPSWAGGRSAPAGCGWARWGWRSTARTCARAPTHGDVWQRTLQRHRADQLTWCARSSRRCRSWSPWTRPPPTPPRTTCGWTRAASAPSCS